MILSTYIPDEESFQVESGTSMAAPHVTGVAALVPSESPRFDYKDIRDAILNGANKVPSLDGLVANSARLNANGAVSQSFLLQI